MLSLFINQPVDSTTQLERPEPPQNTNSINRPELKAYDLQIQQYAENLRLTRLNLYPQLSAFFQGGMGQPNPMNLLSTSLSPYYFTGLRLSWTIGGAYTYKKDRLISLNNQEMVKAQRGTFLFNTEQTMHQENADIRKYRKLIQSDDDIVNLRESVSKTSAVQLRNGVISANDYLLDVNAAAQARQDRAVHAIQLLMTQYNYKTTSEIETQEIINRQIHYKMRKSFFSTAATAATTAALIVLTAVACNQNKLKTDASGVFESDEVIVSAEQNGKLLSFPIQEGDSLAKGAIVGQIDMSNTIIQKEQVEATIQALKEKTTNPRPQIELVQRQLAVEESQLEQQQREKVRTGNLLKADAATGRTTRRHQLRHRPAAKTDRRQQTTDRARQLQYRHPEPDHLQRTTTTRNVRRADPGQYQ